MGYNFGQEDTGHVMSLEEAAAQALWDLQQWVKDHLPLCDCFTCMESIPDLKNVLPQDETPWGV